LCVEDTVFLKSVGNILLTHTKMINVGKISRLGKIFNPIRCFCTDCYTQNRTFFGIRGPIKMLHFWGQIRNLQKKIIDFTEKKKLLPVQIKWPLEVLLSKISKNLKNQLTAGI